MKKITILITVVIICLNCCRSYSQTFVVDTLLYNGDKNKLLNIVMMGDGYTSGEQAQFVTDATNVKDYFFSQAPFSNYANYFNVFAIEVPSNESGANHPGTSADSDCPPVPVSTADNYFGSTFDSYGIHRLVCIQHYDSASYVLTDNFPVYDIVLVIVNSPYYGGSGGYYAVSTTNVNSGDVSVHEIGHSFGDLADEYWSGSPWEAPNETQDSDPSTIRWKNWLYDNGIGIYAFSEDNSWYRPHQGCKMRMLNVPFCSVCSESLIEKIHSMVNPVYNYSPSNSSTLLADTALLDFSLYLLQPIPNTLKTEWETDGILVSTNTDNYQIDPDTLVIGSHQVVATITDTTVLTRSDDHWTTHIYNVTWNITKSLTGININTQMNSTDILLYPNPFSDKLNISYHIDAETKVVIEIIDANGKIVKKVINKKQSAGNYELSLDAAEIGNIKGTNFIRFTFNNHIIVEPIMKLE
ncbi:MAG: M64 family metallopeptidase [Bacteroidota bacterium]